MKQIRNILLLLLGSLLLFSSCKKYEEGPLLSFSKPENRIRGIWELSSVYKDGHKTDSESPSEVETPDGTWELYKSTTVLITYYNGLNCFKSDGSWSFKDDKEKLELTFTTRYAVLTRTYKILRLTHKEMKLQFTDENGTEWTLEFSILQSFSGYEY